MVSRVANSRSYGRAAKPEKNKLGACDFYAQKLMVQDHTSRMPHAGGRLFQQYVVDAYCKIEAQRLDWVDKNQDKLRTETSQGLLDYVHSLDTPTIALPQPADVPRAAAIAPQPVKKKRAALQLRHCNKLTRPAPQRQSRSDVDQCLLRRRVGCQSGLHHLP